MHPSKHMKRVYVDNDNETLTLKFFELLLKFN